MSGSIYKKAGLCLKVVFAAVATFAATNTPAASDGLERMPPTDRHESITVTAVPGPQPVEGPWQEMLRNDTINFENNTPRTGATRPVGQNTVAAQIESYSSVASSLLLAPGSDLQDILTDHIGAAAAVMNDTADRMSGRDVTTLAINREAPISTWGLNEKSPYARALLANTNVLSLSMGGRSGGDQSVSCGDGNVFNLEDAAVADELWRTTHGIMVQSAGNEGDDGGSGPQRDDADMTVRADTFMFIGEAAKDTNGGGFYIVDYSSRGGVSVVVTNPYRSGFSYKYYTTRSADELRRRLVDFYNARDPASGKLNREIFAERLARPVYKGGDGAFETKAAAGQNAPCRMLKSDVRPDFTTAHPAFPRASFPGKEALTMPPEWQAAHAEQVLEAFINCLVDAQTYYQSGEYGHRTRGGYFTGMIGTSFAAPHAGGMLAAMHEKYPQLSEYDLNAAALMAAVPLTKVETDEVGDEGQTIYRTIHYSDNGRGLRHNDDEAGFGLLSEDAYARLTAQMAAALRANPALATHETRAESALTAFNSGGREYRLQVDEDIVALRANLALKFSGGNAGV
ncbi:MAG TPA: S8 family serine peptidase, partial [Patescibacteria group bacterium]|nr:S8 family serine peptidase [Patescibacteria group bacterium]